MVVFMAAVHVLITHD